MATLFHNIDAKDPRGGSLFSLDTSTVRLGSSADVFLEDGIKSPDFSLYEYHPKKDPLMRLWPTVVWEVAYSENGKKLAYDLGRYVACSLGRVRLAIGVKIERNRATGRQSQGLKQVTCTFWEADYVETFATFEEAGSQMLDRLIRCDDYADEADDCVVPAATKFSCVSLFKGDYLKFVVSQRALYTVSAFPLEHLSAH
jgi:hypothetical protein